MANGRRPGWPFFLTYEKTYTKVISDPNISEDDVLQVLHDPPALIGLNPLVTKCVPALDSDPSQPMVYTVHDDLRVFKVFKTEVVYSAKFTRTSDGTDTHDQSRGMDNYSREMESKDERRWEGLRFRKL
ncbi:hypothetical protein BT96DRAFT_247163 [Gymnopus androsaceus JB14]|uniref:DUF7053 domain-containing protein n=1 Tax=Gymnopus androsaceus JB14 TaxID=1447944 RepID=A0A6A4IQM7_9AGAR|nr:hypothetical protein BT96DRAFT_247163 [Gymnopus androsaceus JB14]